MAWVNDLASVAGIPVGVAALAVAMYAACSAAEKAARPEALKDIGRILKDSSWERSVRPSAIIDQVFVWTFGERQLSWKCSMASITSTLLFCVLFIDAFRFFGTLLLTQWGTDSSMLIKQFALFAIVPDFIALGKTRLLLRHARLGRVNPIILIGVDITLSLTISTVVLFLGMGVLDKSAWTAWRWIGVSWDAITERYLGFSLPGFAIPDTPGMPHMYMVTVWHMFVFSTLFTSVWTILVLLSTTALKLLAPVHRFTAWFFDVEKHPVQAIGIVAGALVMIASLIWTMLRAVI